MLKQNLFINTLVDLSVNLSQSGLVMIVVKIDGVLATRPRAIYLGRRPHRAALILSNLLSALSRSSLEIVL